MTCKVRRDLKIITDVISRVSLVTSNICESSICSSKSPYKKTSNEILAELKAVIKTGALKVPEAPTRHTPVWYDRSAVTSVCQTASSHTHCHHREEGKRRNFSSCSDHNRKTTAIFFPLPSSLSISFSVDFFLYSTKRWSYGTFVALQKGAFWLPSTMVTNVIYFYCVSIDSC